MRGRKTLWATVSCAAGLALIAAVAVMALGPGAGRAVPALQLPPVGRSLPPVTWEHADTLGEGLPDRCPVYRVAPQRAGPEEARRLAALLGLEGPVESKGPIYVVSDGARQLVVNRDGTFSYVTPGRWPEPLPSAADPCSDAEAVALAGSFLRERGLLPAEFQPSRVEPAVAARGDDLAERVVGKTVLYRRAIGGLPVLGVSRIDVDVARCNGGLEVVGVSSYWRRLEPYRTMPLRGVASALSELVAGRGAIDLPEGADRARVERVTLAYWESPNPERQPYLHPVYHFEGTAWVEGEPRPFVANVAALDPEVTQEHAEAPQAAPVAVVAGAPSSGAVVRGGQPSGLDPAALAGVAAALESALGGFRGRVTASGPVAAVEAKVGAELGRAGKALDLAYSSAASLAPALDRVPQGLERDAAGRAIIRLRRLVVLPADEWLHFACLGGGEGAQGVIFAVPRGPGGAALERLMGL
ncbi:MAG: hypothetical protein K6T75_00665 [Acetobacteraceae bacterium]|nr:hypothetical protein [Acetobacteraceae bacterium]